MSTEGDAVSYPCEIGHSHTLHGLLLPPMSPNTFIHYCVLCLLTVVCRCLQAVTVTVRLRARSTSVQLCLHHVVVHGLTSLSVIFQVKMTGAFFTRFSQSLVLNTSTSEKKSHHSKVTGKMSEKSKKEKNQNFAFFNGVQDN